MQPALVRTSVAILCLISLLAQSLGAGLEGGVLCVGCDRIGWTIAGPEARAGARGCCADEGEPTGHRQVLALEVDGRCGCIAIPLVKGLRLSVASPRVEPLHDAVAVVVTASVVWVSDIPACEPGIRPRAGPTHPPRLLLPSSRRTVLVV